MDDIQVLRDEIRALRQLLDERPALNAGLVEAYHEWTTKVYRHDMRLSKPAGETLQ